MSRILSAMIAVGFVFALGQPAAEAQFVRQVVYYPAPVVQPVPVIQRTAYVQPATVVYRPVLRPVATFAAPAPRAVYYAPRPVVAYRQAIPVVPVVPAPIVTTRYRPILGGTVTRTWYP